MADNKPFRIRSRDGFRLPALLIDIDDTITRERSSRDNGPTPSFMGQPLLWLMRELAMADHGKSRADAEAIICDLLKNVRWWHYTDFLLKLGLDPHRFWQAAYDLFKRHLEPVDVRLPHIIERLAKAGYPMFITSNNPSSGIMLKLSVAGLGSMHGSPWFLQYFCPCDLHHMKVEAEFWRRVLAHTGLAPEQIITIGDSFEDDVLAPRGAGITRNLLLPRGDGHDGDAADLNVTRVANWREIASLLLAEQGPYGQVPLPTEPIRGSIA